MEQQFSTSRSVDNATTTADVTTTSADVVTATAPSLEATILTALRFNNAEECRRLAQEAANLQDLGTIRALHAFVNHRTLTGRQRFEPARIAAIEALAAIGNPSSLPVLTAAILDRSPAIQEAASRAVLTYGPAAADALLATLEHPGNWPLSGMKTLIATIGELGQTSCARALACVLIDQLPNAPSRWKMIFKVPAAVIWSIICLILFSSWNPLYSFWMLIFLMFPYLSFHFLILGPIYLARKDREQKEIIGMLDTAIPAMRDQRILPIVIAAYATHTKRAQSQRVSRRLLLELLPLLSEADMYTFPLYSRSDLVSILETNDQPLVLEILRALYYVGNAQSVVPVRRLAEYSNNPEIQQRAAELLPILEQRIRDARSASHLLRPSQEPITDANQLLRPTLNATDSPPEELLRPQQLEPPPLDSKPDTEEQTR